MSYHRKASKTYSPKRRTVKPPSKTKMFVSAFVFDAPELTLAEVEVMKVKRKYAIVEYRGNRYEIPKEWLKSTEEIRGKKKTGGKAKP